MSEETLRAEVAEARRITRWLYQNHLTPEARRTLGDMTAEWPWLLAEDTGSAAAPRTIRVTPEQRSKALRDAARNSRVKVVVPTLRRLVREQLERDPQR